MSSIKDKRRENNNDELSEDFQDVEIVIRQELDTTLEKIIQSKMKNNNQKTFSHKLSDNDNVNYIASIEKKRARNKNLKAKREY